MSSDWLKGKIFVYFSGEKTLIVINIIKKYKYAQVATSTFLLQG